MTGALNLELFLEGSWSKLKTFSGSASWCVGGVGGWDEDTESGSHMGMKEHVFNLEKKK